MLDEHDGDPEPTAAARALYRRHRLDLLPGGRAEHWSPELPPLRAALAELSGADPASGADDGIITVQGSVLDTRTAVLGPRPVPMTSAAATGVPSVLSTPRGTARAPGYDPAGAAKTLARMLPTAHGTVALGSDVVAAQQRLITLITKVAELPALPPPDPSDRYTMRALTVNWLRPKSPHTERGYLRELRDWLTWCENNSMGPPCRLTAPTSTRGRTR